MRIFKPVIGKYVEKTEWIQSLKENGISKRLFKNIYMRLPHGRCHYCGKYLKLSSVIYITKNDSSESWSGRWFCHEKCSKHYSNIYDREHQTV